MKRLQLESAKLHSNEGKAALQLLGILFTDEELVNGNPRGVTNSNDEARKKNIRQLDPRRMNYIKGTSHFLYAYNLYSLLQITLSTSGVKGILLHY